MKICTPFLVTLIAALLFQNSPACCQAQQKDTLYERQYEFLLDAQYPAKLKDVFTVLGRFEVRKELEMVGDQFEKLKKLQNRFRFELERELSEIGLLPLFDESEMEEKSREMFATRQKRQFEIENDYTNKLNEILLPAQQERLGQILIQTFHSDPVYVSAFKSRFVAERVGFSEADEKTMSEIATKAEEDYLKELRALKLKYHKKVRDSLGKEQAVKIHEILGDPYVIDPPVRNKLKR